MTDRSESSALLAGEQGDADETRLCGGDPAAAPALSATETSRLVTPSLVVRSSWRIERALMHQLYRRIGAPDVEILLWDGTRVDTSRSPQGRIVIRSPQALRKLVFNPRVGFGEAYMDGMLELEGDVVKLVTALNFGLSRHTPPGRGRHIHWTEWIQHTLKQSRASVAHHYDIGNAFYQLWLDAQLVYTCAYYPTAETTLDEAQTAKLDYVCRKLRLRPGDRVAEAGCGWGALALHMARKYGVNVDAWNLSSEQIAYARERAQQEGLSDRVRFHQDDYRRIAGEYDVFVSVGMLEHVGIERYHGLGRLMDRVLTPAGRGLIHTIGRNWERPLDPWTRKYIFPGACPPSLRQMMDLFETSGFSVLDVENLRLHYARTCADWLERFEGCVDQVRNMFDERFVRMWRLYLAAASAAFISGDLQLFQVVFSRAADNSLPWTRADWYDTTPESK